MTSLYYQANRSCPLTPVEQERITQILRDSAACYPHVEIGETLCQYSRDLEEDPACIFSGAVKLPYSCEIPDQDLINIQSEALFFFMEWLTKLRRALPDAQWDVSLEGFPFLWEEESGWRLMTDEEYQAYC